MFDPLRECVCGEFILPLDRHYGYFLFTIAGSFYNVPQFYFIILLDKLEFDEEKEVLPMSILQKITKQIYPYMNEQGYTLSKSFSIKFIKI